MRILILAFLLCAAAVQAQWSPWNQYQLLIDDTVGCVRPDFAIDDSFRLYVYYVRLIRPYFPPLKSLYYQRFDNWGNPLSSPLEVAPDTTSHRDWDPGVLLARNGDLHIVWLRVSDGPEETEFAVYYARMSVNGEFLTPSCILPHESRGVYPAGSINLVQDSMGVVWFTCGDSYGAVTETGQLVNPLRKVLEDSTFYATNLCLARTPNDQIWACARVCGGGCHKQPAWFGSTPLTDNGK